MAKQKPEPPGIFPEPERLPIVWRGRELTWEGEACSFEDGDLYAGVAREGSAWSAYVELEYLDAEGVGATAVEALDAALVRLRQKAKELPAEITRLFGEP